MHPSKNSSFNNSTDNSLDTLNLFNAFGVNSQQFHLLFGDFQLGIALFKTVYDDKSNPVDFAPLAFNQAYGRLLNVMRNAESAEWLNTCVKVASTGIPNHLEFSNSQTNNNYHVYICEAKKGYLFSTLADITEYTKKIQQELQERLKAERELLENAEKYRYLLKNAPTGIYEVDYDGPKFKSVNDAMCQILGYTEQELLAMNPFDVFYSGSKKVLQKRIARIFEGKKCDESVEYHLKTKDGQGIWGLLRVKVLYKNGAPESALIVAHDVTAHKKAMEQLAFAEKRYRSLYETTQDGIMARDLEGKMIDCNQAYAKMLGYTKKELKRLTVKQLLPEEWHEQRERIVNKVLQTGRSIVFEREYNRKDGSIFPASVRTWRLTDGKGKAIGIWSIVRDISDQKILQKKLEQYAGILEKIVEERTKKLKDSERLAAIGQTAGMVGHDLRNPLQTVIGELYLAKCDVESFADGEAKNSLQESIRVIEEQAIYMDKIVSDLQAFVRPLKIDKKPVSIGELINSVLSTIVIPDTINLQVFVDDGFPEVKADPQLLKRVLINLVTNAVQAMPNGGKLTLKCQVNPQGQVSVTVEDTGVGIPEKIKPQIFTPLFTTKPRGQGFGLAVCKRVMEAHGGSIAFESEEGKGATFTIAFPIS
jgi:PAS domain S-box-containing protein